jgi:hypothetical protein
MKYAERKQMMEGLDTEQLNGGKTAKDIAEGTFRYYVLQLLADIADQQGSMAYAYQEMLKMQQAKARKANPNESPYRDLPPTTDSRYGGSQK